MKINHIFFDKYDQPIHRRHHTVDWAISLLVTRKKEKTFFSGGGVIVAVVVTTKISAKLTINLNDFNILEKKKQETNEKNERDDGKNQNNQPKFPSDARVVCFKTLPCLWAPRLRFNVNF